MDKAQHYAIVHGIGIANKRSSGIGGGLNQNI